MKTMKTILLCTLALFLTAGSCKKNAENRLPPATQTGANTFGCKINGVVYKCKGWWKPGTIFLSQGVSASYRDGKVGIVALTKSPDANLSIEFKCPTPKPGIYKDIILFSEYPTEKDFDNYVQVTHFDDEIISGVFQLKSKQVIDYYDDGKHITGEGKTYIITEGRFDIKRNN